MKNFKFQNYLIISVILVLLILSNTLFRAPKPQLANISKKEFSAYRAFEHIKMIAQKPHSLGTDEHEKVRDYIILELKRLGIKVSTQKTISISDDNGLRAAYVNNIIGKIEGRDSQKCVLIVGHYDSQPNTLGAADDGAAVASMLEAARALTKSDKLRNDIVFLFTDGEESGLFGAKVFVDENSLKDSVGIVLNIEARGSSGPSITYEVSPQNGWIMQEYAKAVPYPIANSFAYEVYKLLPNNSDFTPLKESGLSGFNIGFIDDFVNYHSMTDSPEKISLGSVQHHGSYIMGISRHFGNLNLSKTKSNDVVYFNLLGYGLIIYPVSWNFALAILVVVLMLVALYIGLRDKRLSIFKTLIGIGLYILTLGLVLFASWFLLWFIKRMHPHYANFYSFNFYNVKDYFWAFTFITITLLAYLSRFFSKKINYDNFYFGSLLFSFIIMILLVVYIPSGSYLIIVPLLLVLIGLVISYSFKLSFENKPSLYLFISVLFIIPCITLYVPMIKMLFITFGLETIYGAIFLIFLLQGFMLLLVKVAQDTLGWKFYAISVSASIIFIATGSIQSDYTSARPLQSNVSYILDSNKGEAYWFSTKKYIDEWKMQFFEKSEIKPLECFNNNLSYSYIQSKATVYDLKLPQLMLISDSISKDRRVKFKIKTTREAQNCQLLIDARALVKSISINGKVISKGQFYSDTLNHFHSLYYFGLKNKDLEVSLECSSLGKFDVVIIESKLGLPDFQSYKSMPNNIIADKGFFSNVSFINRKWNL